MKESEKIKPKIKRQEKCEFCNDVFWNLDHHSKSCKDRKRFIDELDEKGILTRDDFEEEIIWVSGGLKVVLTLRGKLSTADYLKKEKKLKKTAKEDIKLITNLLKFEKKREIRIEYDSGEDELDLSVIY